LVAAVGADGIHPDRLALGIVAVPKIVAGVVAQAGAVSGAGGAVVHRLYRVDADRGHRGIAVLHAVVHRELNGAGRGGQVGVVVVERDRAQGGLVAGHARAAAERDGIAAHHRGNASRQGADQQHVARLGVGERHHRAGERGAVGIGDLQIEV
jgi:hypothetical protein